MSVSRMWVLMLAVACGRYGYDGPAGADGGGGGDAAAPGEDAGEPPPGGGEPLSRFALAMEDTCYLDGGRLLCWGASHGASPVEGGGTDWIELAGGELHFCGIRSGGTLWCWGQNFEGELGVGDRESRASPVQVGPGQTWEQVGLSRFYSCAITVDGALYCWGRNSVGQLGIGTSAAGDFRSSPERVGAGSEWQQVCTGGNHTCAIRTDGSLWCWGSNDFGQLGLGSGVGPATDAPRAVGGTWDHVACGKHHTCAIRSDRSLWCWGRNFEGQLGLGDRGGGTDRDLPVRVAGDSAWTDLGVSRFVTCGVLDDLLYCWGYNELDGVGIPGQDFYDEPTLASDRAWTRVGESNGEHLCAVADDASVWCWGPNGSGQLGTGDTSPRDAPTRVQAPGG